MIPGILAGEVSAKTKTWKRDILNIEKSKVFQEHPATDSLPVTFAHICVKCSCSLMTTGDMDNINWKK